MRKNSQTANFVLLALEKAVDGYLKFEDFAYNSSLYAQGIDRPLTKSNLSQLLRRLREEGLISHQKINNKVTIKLTDKGKLEALIRKALTDNNWDGKWRVVVFDIPEQNRKIRNILRSRLKLWQFEPWQQSVWATKKNIAEPLAQYLKEAGLEKYVKVLEAETVY